jgi:hypothetical protein
LQLLLDTDDKIGETNRFVVNLVISERLLSKVFRSPSTCVKDEDRIDGRPIVKIVCRFSLERYWSRGGTVLDDKSVVEGQCKDE